MVEAAGIDRSCTESPECRSGDERRLARASREQGWRRRESNPRPRGFKCTFVHARSRCVPSDWARGFGRDLSLAISVTLSRASSRDPALVIDARRLPGRSGHWTLRAVIRPRAQECRCRSHLWTSRLIRRSRSRHAQMHSPSPRRSRSPPWVLCLSRVPADVGVGRAYEARPETRRWHQELGTDAKVRTCEGRVNREAVSPLSWARRLRRRA